MSDEEEVEDFSDLKKPKVKTFIPFNKLVEQIGVDSDKFSRRYRLNKDDNGTYFTEAITKWNDQDLGVDFVNFSNELPSAELETFAQLLYHSKTIITSLLTYMTKKTKSSQAFCEILTALAKDLREDFAEYAYDALDAVTFVLDDGEQEKEAIEAGFYCLTSLVKVVSKPLLKTMKKTFNRFATMMGSSRTYVQRFAAQSLAFLARKIGDLPDFIKYVVEQVEKANHKKLNNGVSMFFFQIYRGISGGFQSSVDQLLRDIILGVLRIPEESTKEVGMEVLSNSLKLTVKYVCEKKKILDPVQNVFMTMLEHNKNSTETTDCLRLFSLTLVKLQSTVLFTEVERLFKLAKALARADHLIFNEHSISFLHLTLTNVLENSKFIMSSKEIFIYILDRYHEKQMPEIFKLLELCHKLSIFDLHILPCLAVVVESACKKNKKDDMQQIINIFAAVCADRRPVLSYDSGSRTSFFDVSVQSKLKNYVLSLLPNLPDHDIQSAANIVLIWPWLFNEHQQVDGAEFVRQYLEHLLEQEERSPVLSQAALIVASSLFITKSDALGGIPCDKVEAFMKNQNMVASSTLMYSLYIKSADIDFSPEDLKRRANMFLPILFRPNAKLRLSALEVLSACEKKIASKNPNIISEGAFSILEEAEKVDIINSRERLRIFRNILFGRHRAQIFGDISDLYEEVILRIGYAQFFVNFSRLWPGMHELLLSFARGMDFQKFWEVTGEIFEYTHESCKINEETLIVDKSFEFILGNVDDEDRRDFLQVRIQLLHFFEKIPDLAERKTRTLSPMILDIFTNDFLVLSAAHAGENDEEDEEEPASVARRVLEFKDCVKALSAFLELYSRFADANSVFMEAEIREMYYELLVTGTELMLPVVVRCLLSYKHKHVTPYREHLLALVDCKKFVGQLVLFKISEDEGDEVLSKAHRADVMPILLRIILGHLSRRGDRKTGQSRKYALFRYMGGCQPNEVQMFLELSFRSVHSLVGTDENMYENMNNLCQDVGLLAKVELKKLLKCVINGGDLVERIARVLTDDQKTFVYRYFLCIGVILRNIFLKSAELPAYKLIRARKVRTALCKVFCKFFSVTYSRSFSDTEINQLYDVTVTDYLSEHISMLTGEEEKIIVPPLPAIQIMSTFSKFPNFYYFFTFPIKNQWNLKMSAYDLMVSVLFLRNLTPAYLSMVRRAVIDLASFADEEGMIKRETDQVKIMEDVNYGSSIVLADLDRMLTFLIAILENDVEKKTINPENLEIINKVADYVHGGPVAEKLAFTILGYLLKKLPREDICLKMLRTLGNLSRGIIDYEKFLRTVSPLFSSITGRVLRSELTEICANMILNPHVPDDIKDLLGLCADLDSWDRTKCDEPDHDRRHGAYSRIYKISEIGTPVNPLMLRLICNSCFHTFANTSDISLRSTSASTSRYIIEFLQKANYDQETKAAFIRQTVVPLILKCLNNEQEVVRDETIRCLRTAVVCFSDFPNFNELIKLVHENPDQDFFQNMYHIQTHRRQRALATLLGDLTEKKLELTFPPMNIFLYPMIYPYLLKTEEKHEQLADLSLKLYDYMLKLSPLTFYMFTLRRWIAATEKNNDERRPYVRILCSVIDAFHFEVADADDVLNEDGSNAEAIEIRQKMKKEIIPQLQFCMNGRGTSDAVHKTARTGESKYNADRDDMARAPVALATVKLLLKLPKDFMDQFLHGVILRLCKLIISRSVAVRKEARKVAIRVLHCLGPLYLSPIIKEIKFIMNKGYQIHIMVFTVHALIIAMQSHLTTGILDTCIEEIMDACILDQFDDVSEEKNVGAIRAHTYEAKSDRSAETMFYVGKFISSSVIGLVIQKLQEVLETKVQKKTVVRAGAMLSKFALGIKENDGIPFDDQLILAHSVLTENVQKMENVNRPQETTNSHHPSKPESCLIIPMAPRRLGAIVKTSVKSRVHVFVEFALQLLGSVVKGKRFSDEEKPKIETFVPIVLRCLALKYDTVVIPGLLCMYSFISMELTSARDNMKPIIERLFVLLSDYVSVGDANTECTVTQLNCLVFKSFTRILYKGFEDLFNKTHVDLLLNYIETDVMDAYKQATAFSLIKSIIRRKMKHERIPVVMKRIMELGVTSTQLNMRNQSRQAICCYVFEHPSCNRNEYIEFFADQLDYEHTDGRSAAAEILFQFFSELLPENLEDTYMYCLTKLGLRLVNETVPACRKYVVLTMRKLLETITDSMKADVVDVAIEWLKQPKEAARSIGFSVFVQLSHVEKQKFYKNMDIIVQKVNDILSSEDVMDMNSEISLTILMDGLAVILNNIGTEQATDVVNTTEFCQLIGRLEPILQCFGSTETRRTACALLGLTLSLWDTPIKLPEGEGIPTVRKLCDWMCWLVKDNIPNEAVSEQASKNIIFMAPSLSIDDYREIVVLLYKTCMHEIMNNPKCGIKRLACFKIAAALMIRDKDERLECVLENFFGLFVRELDRKSILASDDLFNLTTEIATVLENLLGEPEYNRRFAEAQKVANEKKALRKQAFAELAITAPHELAERKRKIVKHSIQSKKRKLDAMKPHRITKRREAEERRLRRDEDW